MTLDTNILIAFINGDDSVVSIGSEWKQEGRALYVSSIVFAEVLSYPAILPSDVETIREFVNSTVVIPFDNALAETTAFFKRTYNLKLPDAAIAATAFSRNTPIVTRDRQFHKIKEISVLKI
jgi:predicted nucleic acid-binding protein